MDVHIEPITLDRAAGMLWRKADRPCPIAERWSLTADERRRHAAAIARHLTDALGDLQGQTVGVDWPCPE